MSIPKRHHYIPQMLLRGFIDDRGLLHWCFTGGGDKSVRAARPAEVFIQRHLYSTVAADGSKDPSVERDFLSSLEGATAPVVEAILNSARNDHPPVLTLAQKRTWNFFFLTQWRRTPENQQAVANDADAQRMLDDIIGELRASAPHRKDDIDALSTGEAKARIVRNVRIDMLIQESPNVQEVLDRRGIAVLRIKKPGKSFIIGSRPVVKLTGPERTDLMIRWSKCGYLLHLMLRLESAQETVKSGYIS